MADRDRDELPPRSGRRDAESRHVSLSSRDTLTHGELRVLDSSLAGLFVEGLSFAQRVAEPGVTFLLGHAGRELSRGVVRVLAQTVEPLTERDIAAIAEDEKNRVTLAAVLGLPPEHHVVTTWFQANQVFSSACHFSTVPTPPEEVQSAFRRLADLLFGRLGPYFTARDEVDRLLGLSHPSSEDTDHLVALLGRPALRRYFFLRVSDVGWFVPLLEAGYFRHPPDRKLNDDGSWQWREWLEGTYLVRVAPADPERVVSVLEAIPRTNGNPPVWRTLVKVAIAVPRPYSERLARRLRRAIHGVIDRFIAHEVEELIRRLANDGAIETAFGLAESLLAFVDSPARTAAGQHLRGSEWMLRGLGQHELQEFLDKTLPSLETLDSERALKLLVKKLAYATNLGDTVDKEETHSQSSKAWCRRLDRRGSVDDVRAQLARSVTALAVKIACSGPDAAEVVALLLLTNHQEIFTRIFLVVLANAGQYIPKRLDEFIASKLAIDPPFRARETALVLRTRFGDASPEAQRLFCYGVERGPSMDHVSRRMSIIGDVGLPSQPLEDVVASWQRDRLKWFQAELPKALEPLAQRINWTPRRLSPKEEALAEDGFYVGSGGWAQDVSPKTADELAWMSPEEMCSFLHKWTPDRRSSRLNEPNVEGLQRAVTEYVVAHPAEAAQRLGLALKTSVAPWYLQSFLSGFQKAGADVPWTDVLRFTRDVLSLAAGRVGEGFRQEISANERRAWQWAAVEAIDLLGKVAAQRYGADAEGGLLWEAIDVAITSAALWADDDARTTPPSSFGDMLTAALNRFSGRATRALFEAARWTYDLVRDDDPARTDAALAAVRTRLLSHVEHIISPTATPSVSALTVVGEHVPELWFFDRPWLQQALPSLFADGARDPLHRPAWGGYLTTGRLFYEVFEDLRPWYVEASTQLAPAMKDDDYWSLRRHLLSHLTLLVEHGLVAPGNPDRLLEAAYEQASLKERAHSYWEIFSRWSDSEKEPEADVIERLVDFWRWRLEVLESISESPVRREEARALGWLFCVPYSLDSDVIALGRRTLVLASGELEMHGRAWERLTEIASRHPSGALELMEPIVFAILRHDYPYLPFEEAGPVLRAILLSKDASVRDRTERLVHRIGEQLGQDEFRSLLGEE